MKRKTIILLALIVAAAIVYGAVTLLSPKSQYVLVPTDGGRGQGGQFGPTGDGPPANMIPPDSQPSNAPATGKIDSKVALQAPQKPSAAVNVEEENTKTGSVSTKQSNTKKLPMVNPPKQAGAQPMRPGQKDGRAMPDAMRSKFELMRAVMDIGRLEESKKDSITSSQAKAILAVIAPLRSKKTLDAAQAKTAASKLNAILTSEQKKTISELPRREMKRPDGQDSTQRPSGPPPSDGSQPGGPPPNMGPRPEMDTNPLSSSSKSPMAEHINKMIKALEVKAKG